MEISRRKEILWSNSVPKATIARRQPWSRDIAGMGLAKSRDGYYVLPEDLRLQRMVGELVETIEIVNNFLVIRTPPGIASGVAVALDAAQLKGVAGTLAGDDSIFVMCRSSAEAQSVAEVIEHLQDRQ